ncbi:MAG TPA: PH domain-containing protein [bacterium]|nr:PH domain-containing protein [bacterium]
MPYKTLFPGQEPNEKIILILRKHGWVFLKIVFFYLVLSLLPWLAHYLIQQYTELLAAGTLTIILNLLTSIYYIYILTFFFRAWIDYYFDVGVITNERIVDIEQNGLFSRNISALRLYRVQDVASQVRGFLPTLLHFGTVSVQTAGSVPRFIFDEIANPYETSKNILELVQQKKHKMIAMGINPDLEEEEEINENVANT